jgi:DNA-directed RNA polymerase subunit RPC12/RpoP
MPRSIRVSYLCGVCATPRSDPTGTCTECGSDVLLKAVDGFVLSFPANTVPCPRCGSTTRPLVFRGWVRLVGFLWWAREGRASAYICRPCAESQASVTLAMNALLGWWSVGSWFFYGWRALFHNWRAVWMAPLNPGTWGALDAAAFAASVHHERESAFEAVADEIIKESPLRFLTRTQQELVLGATDLYELLGASAASSLDELRAAFRTRCKEIHPDLHTGGDSATEDMIRLNNAWEILRSEPMRRAYDWLEAQRAGVPS